MLRVGWHRKKQVFLCLDSHLRDKYHHPVQLMKRSSESVDDGNTLALSDWAKENTEVMVWIEIVVVMRDSIICVDNTLALM